MFGAGATEEPMRGSPREVDTTAVSKLQQSVCIPRPIKKQPVPPWKAPTRTNKPSAKDLPKAFRSSRPLYDYEIDYVKKIYGPSIDYSKVRVTRDHQFSRGSTKVVGNTIHFTSKYGGEWLWEDTPEEGLTEPGLRLLAHEIGHVWQFQNGGWAYAGESLTKQAAGFYATGSRNTAYDWQTAIDWEIPWEKWGPEQQAEAVDQWNQAMRYTGDRSIINAVQPYIEKVRKGEGVTQFSPAGTAVVCAVTGGIGYLLGKGKGVAYGVAIGVLLNLPWNAWTQ